MHSIRHYINLLEAPQLRGAKYWWSRFAPTIQRDNDPQLTKAVQDAVRFAAGIAEESELPNAEDLLMGLIMTAFQGAKEIDWNVTLPVYQEWTRKRGDGKWGFYQNAVVKIPPLVAKVRSQAGKPASTSWHRGT